jgi:hypothetical protein
MADSGHASAFYRYIGVDDFVAVPRKNYVRQRKGRLLAVMTARDAER